MAHADDLKNIGLKATLPRLKILELFQNLIENGTKYNLTPAKKVIVKVLDEHSFWHFTIADNGIGFDQQYAEQIFKIFKCIIKSSRTFNS